MSTEKRKVLVEQEVEYAVCNECGHSAPSAEAGVGTSWTHFAGGPYNFGDIHFCSMTCFVRFAKDWAERH